MSSKGRLTSLLTIILVTCITTVMFVYCLYLAGIIGFVKFLFISGFVVFVKLVATFYGYDIGYDNGQCDGIRCVNNLVMDSPEIDSETKMRIMIATTLFRGVQCEQG